MKYFYIGGVILWTTMLAWCIKSPITKPTAEMSIQLNTPTPIVTTGNLTIKGLNGYQRTMPVEAGDTFILRSTP